jgi:hypothetical protein
MVANTLLARFHRPPHIGIIALAVVALALPLTHSLSVLALNLFGPERSFYAYFPIGVVALGLLIAGVRRDTEVSGTILGLVAGLMLWTGWASYSFRFNGLSLGLPMPELVPGYPWPNNLLYIQGSVGICVVTLLYFVLRRGTRCSAFLWLQRNLRLGVGRSSETSSRNVCLITFIETVYVTWFFYSASLFLADPRYAGYESTTGYIVVAALVAWGVYLLWRLMRFTRVMAAIRYAIPTKAVLWIPFGETFPKYGWYDEVWLEPWRYQGTMLVALVVFVVLFVVTGLMPQRRLTSDE